ncbi:hypothetical protein [Aliikangiella coralliicola]|uniref:Uncharacterized protein n=1 Tax=Aliikangiella coralliicola TaxID=2592383 RepID=A0A545UFI5_9GAMM|nr:hypothetical protein [Aliikangiella coralliicola]TQV88228.1 hypothetical protein FLL46_06795 [Aliikangiella coralliicola]
MNFEKQFYQWINQSLTGEIPPDVRAFSFNLFETGENFGIELIGASEFDKHNSDWACEEIFEPKLRQLAIPLSYSGNSWEECLEKMNKLCIEYLNSGEPGANILNRSQGIGIGFVDGELALLATNN